MEVIKLFMYVLRVAMFIHMYNYNVSNYITTLCILPKLFSFYSAILLCHN